MQKKTIVYIDLDGVMVDLYPSLWEKMQFRFPENQAENRAEIDVMWMRLAKEHPRFWVNLQPMSYAKELFAKILDLDPNPYVLSATPQPYKLHEHENCALQKVQWVCDHLTPDLRYRTIITKSKLKQEQVNRDPFAARKILIDDHPGNIRRWIAAGGIGVHHTDINKTLEQLEELKQNDRY